MSNSARRSFSAWLVLTLAFVGVVLGGAAPAPPIPADWLDTLPIFTPRWPPFLPYLHASVPGLSDIGVDPRAFRSSIGLGDFLRSCGAVAPPIDALPIEKQADLVITINHTGLPLIERPAFVLVPSDPLLLKYSRLIFQLPRKNLAVVTFEGVAKGDSDPEVQDWVDSLASIGFGRIVVQYEGNWGRYAVGDFVQPHPVPGLPFFDRRFLLRDDPNRQRSVTDYRTYNLASSIAWPPKAIDLINESVGPFDEGPLFPTPIRIESILADPPPSSRVSLIQEKADLLVEVDVETNGVSVLRPVLPGTPRDMQSLLRSLNAAGDSRKDLAVVTFTGKFTREFPWDELDKWIDALKSTGFRRIIITEETGNSAFTSGDGKPLREWPAPFRWRVPGPPPPPFTFDLPVIE
jgi:hypothetical protein